MNRRGFLEFVTAMLAVFGIRPTVSTPTLPVKIPDSVVPPEYRYKAEKGGGMFQYVQASHTSQGIRQGIPAYWKDIATHVVTTEPGDCLAGMFICGVTPGNYCWIQVAGLYSTREIEDGSPARRSL